MARKKKGKGSRRPWQKPGGLLDRVEAETRLGLGKNWISRRTGAANAPAVTWYGSRPLYRPEDLDRFVEERNRTGADPAHNEHSVGRKPHGGGRPRTRPKSVKRPIAATSLESWAVAQTEAVGQSGPFAEVAALLKAILIELRILRQAVANEVGPTGANEKSDESDLPGFGR